MAQQININKTETKELVSFDIFDTLVTRRVATPSGIFAILHEVLQNTSVNSFLKKNFFRIRTGAEGLARMRARHRDNRPEIRFDEIYELIQKSYNLSDEQTEFLKNLEIETEIKNLVPLNKNINILKKSIEEGKNVVLISDMYYSSDVLRKMLCGIDCVFNDIKIYVSSEHNTSKDEGYLYNTVQREENASYSNWTHYGDNKCADIKMSRRLGIKARHIPALSLMPYEKVLLKKDNSNANFQAIAGSARLARINCTQLNPDKYDFGASFAGPILYNYVDFILEQAQARGFKTLYFVARDGYIPQIIADVIIKKRGLDIKTKYIYGSRHAWRVSTEDNYEKTIDLLLGEFKKNITIDYLCFRLGISKDDLCKYFPSKSDTKVLNKKEINALSQLLKNNEELKSLICQVNNKKAELLTSYLKQELDLNEKDLAFVDLYGSGNTLAMLANHINSFWSGKLYTFYFVNLFIRETDTSKIIPYFTTKKYCEADIELLSKTIQGQTVGYKKEGNCVIPVTEDGLEDKMNDWGINDYIKGIISFVENMEDCSLINHRSFNTIDLYCNYFDYLIHTLDKKTAIVLGDIPYKRIGKETDCKVAAPPLSFLGLVSKFILSQKPMRDSAFPYISAARSSKLVQLLYGLIKDCPTLQKFLFNVYVHNDARIAYMRICGIKISFARMLWKER